MVAFVRAAGRIVVRRLIDDWLMLTVLTATVLAAMVQLAAAPMYRDAVTTGAMQRILADAPAADTTIVVETRAAPEHHAEIDTTVSGSVEGVTTGVGSLVTRRLASASSYDLLSDSSKPIVMSLSAPVGIEDHAGLLDGLWPSPEERDGAALVAAISQRAADELGVAVGDELKLNDRRSGRHFTVRLVGVFEVSDPTSPFWLDDDLLTVGVSETLSTTAVGPLVVDPSVLLGESGAIQPARLVATWLIEPRLDRLTVDAVDDLRRSLDRLPDELERASLRLSPEATSTTSAFDVTSLLPELLLDTNRSLAVTRSGLYAVVAQLALLAALALAIAAGLLIDTRRRETTLLEARGISRRQLIAFALLEAAVLVVPVAVVAPWVAAALLRLVGRVGPLATIDLAVDAPVNREALITVGIAAVITIVLLAWPSVRATTSITNPLSH
ncbi:MAG: hypothetical protein OES24_09520, partial [Acidimicrobiia bacterium]|nr:hypothetical protein [Acidimicrobiia bacterium]